VNERENRQIFLLINGSIQYNIERVMHVIIEQQFHVRQHDCDEINQMIEIKRGLLSQSQPLNNIDLRFFSCGPFTHIVDLLFEAVAFQGEFGDYLEHCLW
jgi:hypothetical protein